MAEPDHPNVSGTPSVGVVTVSYGSAEALAPFLSSLREFHGENLPIAIADNKPGADGVCELAQRFGAIYVPLPENPGYGAGMNAGVRALVGSGTGAGFGTAPGTGLVESSAPLDAFFFCNPDVVFTAPSIKQLADSLLADPNAGSIGPRTLNEDGSVYPSARNIPSVSTGVGHALFGRLWPGNPWSRAYKNASDYDARRVAGWLSGAAVMVKRSVYEEISGWDEAYFLHFEDIDLGYRIGLAGYTNVFEPAVTLVHSGGHSLKKHSAVAESAMTKSAIRFIGKRYSGFWRALLRWAITVGLTLRGAFRARGTEN